MLKPSLSEIFAGVTGMISEGVTLSKKGIKIADHPLTILASDGAMKFWDAQHRVIASPDKQDRIALPLVNFLQSALPVLDQYAALGKTADVRDHVRDILAREASGDTRPMDRFKEGGLPAKPFKADYLGKDAYGRVPALAAG